MRKILIVEDNPDLQKLYATILRGLELRCANSVREAQAILNDEAIDLMLLDLHLPEQSGMELLAQVRAEGRNMVIFAVSADQQLEDEADDLGIQRWFTKPINVLEFRECVDAYLE